jgi:hypothetical protein
MKVILYSKPNCHLCEGLIEKLQQIQSLPLELEIRDITTREDWFAAYQYEVPVLFVQSVAGPEDTALISVPRPSPRSTVQQLAHLLQKYHPTDAK